MAQDISGTNQATGSSATARVNRENALWIADQMPQGAEVSRMGDRFMLGNSAAITGIAPVQALPTTTTQWAIANADPSLSYFFEELGMYLTSGTPGAGGVLLACVFRTPLAATASDAGATVVNMNPGSQKASKAIVKSAQAITTPAAPVWYPIASDGSPNVTAFASSTVLEHRNLAGRLVVPPLWSLGLAVVAPAGTTPLFAPFGQWSEKIGLYS